MPINSREKGCEFERDVAYYLSVWIFGTDQKVIKRTPLSGGYARVIAGGDLICEIQPFPFNVECKHSRGWSWTDLFLPTWGELGSFWKQCTEDAQHDGKIPILIFKGNRTPVFMMFRSEDIRISDGVHRLKTIDPIENKEVTISRFSKDISTIPFTDFLECVERKDCLWDREKYQQCLQEAQEKFPPTGKKIWSP